MVMGDMAQAKKALRKTALQARRSLLPARREAFSQQILHQLQEQDFYKAARAIFCYLSLADEVDTWTLIDQALQAGKLVTVPFIADPSQGRMEAVQLDSLEDLAPGRFGIPTVRPEKQRLFPPAELDCIIVPGAAFDREGGRLGLGGGYYDRFLQRAERAVLSAVAYSCQLMEQVPRESFDLPVDYIITEKECITAVRCGNRWK